MWYEDPRDIERDEKDDKRDTREHEQAETPEKGEGADADYQYTDWASI